MSDLQLDSNTESDLLLTANSLTLTTGREAIRQHIQTTLRLFQGEWFLDTTAGVPWYQDILVKGPSFAVVSAVLRNAILDVEGVLLLVTFDMDFVASTRLMTLEFSVETTEGNIDFSELIEV